MIQPKPCSVLSLDIGDKRIGIAGCDPLGISITHLPAIFRKTFEEDLKEFLKICSNRKVQGLVIGNPLDMKGKETNQSIQCNQSIFGFVLFHVPLTNHFLYVSQTNQIIFCVVFLLTHLVSLVET